MEVVSLDCSFQILIQILTEMTMKIIQKNLPDEAAILILAGVAWVVLAWVLQIIIIIRLADHRVVVILIIELW